MDLEAFVALQTSIGQAALATAMNLQPSEGSFLPCFKRLQREYPASLVRAALETALIRRKARAKFTRADSMYFTRESLEQSSSEAVAHYRAERFRPFAAVGDFCCGIGGDTLGLAAVSQVVAVDLDPLRLSMAERNLAAYGLHEQVEFRQGDLLQMPLPEVEAVFFDPCRRSGGKRHVSTAEYQPPLHIIHEWRVRIPALGVKLAPAVPWSELADYDAEVEFISLAGELKECILWFGPLRTTARRATLLPGRQSLTADGPSPVPSVGLPLAYLYDPDPAVLRAGLVTELAEQLGAHQIDSTIAYLTSDDLQITPFAEVYRIEEALPFQLKRLRERLRSLGVGRLTVKKRGSPLDPAALVRQLRLTGSESRVLFLTQVAGRPYALIGQAASPPAIQPSLCPDSSQVE